MELWPAGVPAPRCWGKDRRQSKDFVNMANRNWLSNKLYQMEAYAVQLSCNFVVTPTNGAGITSLKGAGISSVFMHTSTTPSTGNPNPAAGNIQVKLQDNYNKLLGFRWSVKPPTSGSDVKIDNSALTAGAVYVITTLGNATAAKWAAIGVPAGITPAVGVAFVALTDGGAGNTLTSRVQTASVSGVAGIEVVAAMLANTNQNANGGGILLLQTLASSFTGESYTPAGTNSAPALTMNSYTPAGTNNSATPPIFTGTPATLTGSVAAPTFTGTAHTLAGTIAQALAAPATGSTISLEFYLSNSSVTVAGQ